MSQTVEPETNAKLESHPPGLYALFTTEMWERFAFYGMRALLVLYLTKAMGYSRADALNVYAIYTGLVYLTPLFGGRLADLYLGQRKAVFIGGILMALGQLALTQKSMLHLGLGLMIVGNGLFKPNISVMVGTLYPQGDARRDGAFTLFYMGINLGAFLGPIISGQLAEGGDWSYGFASAAVGMMIGLATFLFTQRLLGRAGLPPRQDATTQARLAPRDWVEVAAIAAGLAVMVYGAIEMWPYVRTIWSPSWITSTAVSFVYKGLFLLVILCSFLWLTEPKFEEEAAELHQPFTGVDWQRLGVIITIGLFSIVFWMGFEQSGGTLNLFADEKTNREVLGYSLKTTWFQSINPIFIISLAPVFATLWTALSKRNFPLPSVAKQGLGLIILSSAFTVMYFAEKQSNAGGLVSPLWLISVYFLFTVAELFVSPIGLSLVTKLAHPRIVSLMMAYWFVCTAAASYLAGIMERTLEPYQLNLWAFLGAMAFVPGVMLLALTPVLVKMSHGRV